jgi:hypothetical protein
MQEAELPENLPPPPGPTGDPDAPNGFAGASDHPYAIFRNRDFTFYLLGRLVALFGQLMFAMAVSCMNALVRRWRWASWDSRKWFRCYCSRCRRDMSRIILTASGS